MIDNGPPAAVVKAIWIRIVVAVVAPFLLMVLSEDSRGVPDARIPVIGLGDSLMSPRPTTAS